MRNRNEYKRQRLAKSRRFERQLVNNGYDGWFVFVGTDVNTCSFSFWKRQRRILMTDNNGAVIENRHLRKDKVPLPAVAVPVEQLKLN